MVLNDANQWEPACRALGGRPIPEPEAVPGLELIAALKLALVAALGSEPEAGNG